MRLPVFCTLLVLGALVCGCGAATPVQRPAVPENAPASARPPAGELSEAAADKTPVRLDYDNNVYFDFGRAVIDGRGIETLGKHAERLLADPRMVVTLVGHTDHQGSWAYNQAICEERLDSVAEVLKARGVARRQIRRIAMGDQDANSGPCRSEGCRQSLRRVELLYEKPAPR